MKVIVKQIFGKITNGILFGIGFVLIIYGYIVYSSYVTITPVIPGQTITASGYNNVISNIEDLNTRVSGLVSTWNKSASDIYYNAGNVGIGNNNPQANLDVSGTVKIFGSRTAISVGTIYQASSDGFIVAFGRADGASGLLYLRLMGGTSSPPASELGVAYSYNNAVNRSSNFQLMVPIKKGEYYQLLCNGLTSCPAPYVIGGYNAYFIPMGS